jgi:hypothetical protein
VAERSSPGAGKLKLGQLRSSRRWQFAAGAAVPAAVIVVLIIATSGGGKSTRSQNPLLPALVSTFSDRAAGISGRLPGGWTATDKRQIVRLESQDRSAIVALAAFPGAKRAPTLLASAVVTVRQKFPDVKIRSAPGTRLAGLPARSAVLTGHNQQKVPIRILLAAARGKTHAYVMDVFTAQGTPGAVFVQIQQIITNLRLTR